MAGRNLLLVALAFLLLAPAALAADVDAAKKLVADLTALRKANDATGFQGELKGVVTTHNQLEDKGLRGKLQKELGAALKAKKMGDAHKAIVKAISELNDSKGAYKQLKKLVPSAKEEEVPDIKLDVLHAVAELAPDAALKSLMELAEKAKHRPSGVAAIDALGRYSKSKKRVEVLEKLVKLIMLFKPATNVQNSEFTLKRWNDCAPQIVSSLNRLTGQKVSDPDEWQQLYKENKKKPGDLFMEE